MEEDQDSAIPKAVVTGEEPGAIADSKTEDVKMEPRVEDGPSSPDAGNATNKVKFELPERVGKVRFAEEEDDTRRYKAGSKQQFSRRESVALQMMDRKHSWLAEVEERSALLETNFISKIQFVALSNHFQTFLDSKGGDLDAVVRGEFSNLFDKFRTCFAGTQRLRNKLFEERSLKALCVAEKRRWGDRMLEGDRLVEILREQLEVSRMEGLEREKEKAMLQQALNDLRKEMAMGKREDVIEEPPRTVPTRDNEEEEEEERQKKILDLQEAVEGLRAEVDAGSQRVSILQQKLDRAAAEHAALQRALTTARSELQRQGSLRERAEGDLQETKEQLVLKTNDARERAVTIATMRTELQTAKNQCNSLLKELKKWRKESDKKQQEFEKLRKSIDIREDRIRTLTSQVESLTVDINTKQGEIKALKVEKSSSTKQRNELVRQVGLMEEKNADLEKGASRLREVLQSQQKRVDALEKEHSENDARIKELGRQKDETMDELLKADRVITSLRTDLKTQEDKVGSMGREIDSFKLEAEHLHSTIKKQNKLKERMAAEALEQARAIHEHKSEARALKLQVSEAEKTVGKLRQELEEQAAKYKALSEDERFYRKSLGDSKRVVEQQNMQLAMLDKTIQQLKTYNQELDERGNRLAVENRAVSDELRASKEGSKQLSKRIGELELKLRHADDQEQSLLKRVSELERNVHSANRTLKNVTQEKDVLSSKVLEKEGQVVACKERVKLLEHEVGLMDKTINERVDDIKLLKLQLSEMNRSHFLMEGRVENLHATRQELTQVHRQLQEQKSTAKGLEGEMQRPVNFHRWRILEGTDPDRAQLVAKTHSLQKELIRKASECDAKDAALGEKDELIKTLKEAIKRRSDAGGDAEEQLWQCRRELRTRSDRLKCLASENSMYEDLVAKYRKETLALREEVKRYKMAEYESRSKPRKKKSV